MRSYDLFIVSLASLFSATTFLMALLGAWRWDLYFSVYLIEYLAAGLLFSSLSADARRVLDGVAYVLAPGFAVIVALKVAEILWGFGR
ncbi:MAG: hypothetical protein HYY02_08040 [Chloroflexi bacterium]|nr:hypothetical protein [Chloroflexota bacterium]